MDFLYSRVAQVNLADYEYQRPYAYSWRKLIYSLKIFFLDEKGSIIPNKNWGDGAFSMHVDYPSVFYIKDQKKVPQPFLNPYPLFCESLYSGEGNVNLWCAVALPFSEKELYTTSLNGTFRFRLQNDNGNLNMTRFQKLMIDINGTQNIKYGPFRYSGSRRDRDLCEKF